MPCRTTLTIMALLAVAACAKPPAPNEAVPLPPADNTAKRVGSTDVVKAEPQPVNIAPGESTEATIILTIQKGYHVNANPPTYPYLIPTALDVSPHDGLSIGQISYPAPINIKLAFAEKPLAVYEGQTAITATMKADDSVKPGERTIPAKLRIQACDNQVCFPPGSIDLTIPVTVK